MSRTHCGELFLRVSMRGLKPEHTARWGIKSDVRSSPGSGTGNRYPENVGILPFFTDW